MSKTAAPKLTETADFALLMMQRRAEAGRRPHGRGTAAATRRGNRAGVAFVNFVVARRLWEDGYIAVRCADSRDRPTVFDLTEKGRVYGH